MNEFDKGFIVGMLEGEGSIGIGMSKIGFLHPYVSISGKNLELLDRVKTILQTSGFKISFTNNASCYKVIIIQRNNLINFIHEVYPFLISKKHRASLMLEFLNKRENNINNFKPTQDRRFPPYSTEEREIAAKIRTETVEDKPLDISNLSEEFIKGFVVGLIEGEGCITATEHDGLDKRCYKTYKGITQLIQMAGINKALIETYKIILERRGIRVSSYVSHPKNKPPVYVVRCHGKENKKLLSWIHQNLISKKERACKLLELIESRTNRNLTETAFKQRYAPYSREEFGLAQTIRNLNSGKGNYKGCLP